jgi:flagellin FlaB
VAVVFGLINKIVEKIHRKEEGITGLGTAIILIAFVIVASVFSYVVLSAGLYSAQKVKEVVHAGLEETMTVVVLKGDVIAEMENSEVKKIYLFVGIPAAGNSVDFTSTENNTNKVVISYMDADHILPSVNWTLQKLSTINADNLLDKNELFLVTVDLSGVATIHIGPYRRFSLEVNPPTGPVLIIERTVPGKVTQYVDLY